MAPTITVDGDEIIDASIDGDAVEEITIDGDLAWAAAVGLDGLTVTRQDGSYTASSGEHVVSNGGTITLPSPVQDGIVMITEVQTTPELIGSVDGITDPSILGDDSVVFVSDGSAWYSVDRNQISAIPDSVIDRPDDTDSASNAQYHGEILNPNQTLNKITATVSNNSSGLTEIGLYQSDGSQIAVDTSVSSAGDTAVFDGLSLSSGTDYQILGYADGAVWTYGFDLDEHPYTSSAGDLVRAVKGDTPSGTSDTGQVRVVDNIELFG